MTLITLMATGLFPLLSWPGVGQPMAFQAAILSFELYRGAFSFALLLFVPTIAASAVTSEREQNTYEMLATSFIANAQLILGKLLAACCFFWLLIVLTFPMVCTLYLVGGFEIWDFLATAVGMVVFVLSLGIVGLSCSVRNSVTSRAVVQAYTITWLLGLIAVWGGSLAGIILSVPWRALTGSLFLSTGTWVWMGIYAGFAFIGLIFTLDLWLSYRSLYRFRQMPTGHSFKEHVRKTQLERASKRRPPRRTRWTEVVLKKAALGIPDRWNPFFLVAVRREVFGTALMRRTLFWSLVVVCVVLVWGFQRVAKDVSYAVTSCTLLMLYGAAILVPPHTASVTACELKPNLLDLLLGSFLGPRELFRGKLLAAFFGLSGLPVVALLTCLCSLLCVQSGSDALKVAALGVRFLITLPIIITATFSSGFLAAILVRRTIPAQVLSYVLSFGYLLATPLLIDAFSGSWRIGQWISPLYGLTLANALWTPEWFTSLAATATAAFLQYRLALFLFWRQQRAV